MIQRIAIVLLSIGIIGVGVWGYQEHQEKNAILIQAENTYQRAFHELSYHMDLLHDTIGTSLAMNSKDRLSPQLVEIWRLTSEAHSNVSQLPLALLPFNKTEEFLANIGNFTYRTSVRDLDKSPLSDEEIQTLENLYKQAHDIKDELRQVQHMVLDNNLRWMDVQLALATDDEPADNTIIDGFKTVEKHVEQFSDSHTDSVMIGNVSNQHKYHQLDGDQIDKQEALKQAKDIFQVKSENDLNITKSGDGADTPLFSITYQDGDKHAYMDMAQNGGHPISLLVDRPTSKKTLSLNEGQKKAEQYLKKYNFNDMQVYQSSEYDHIGVYSFVYNEDGVRIFSDSVEVKVALDNGDILGFTAQNYLMNHRDRTIPKPLLTIEDAEDKVNSNIKIEEQSLAIIDNDLGEEVLAYEFLGVFNDETFRIFINAMNGIEEKVERLSGVEANFAQSF